VSQDLFTLSVSNLFISSIILSYNFFEKTTSIVLHPLNGKACCVSVVASSSIATGSYALAHIVNWFHDLFVINIFSLQIISQFISFSMIFMTVNCDQF
jgi:hypothetical protein